MSACVDVRPLLDLAPLDLLEALEADDRAALQAHLEGCGACRAEAAALGAALAADRAAVEEEVMPMSSSLRERLVAAAEAAPEQEKKVGPGPLAVDPARVDEVGRRIALSCSFCHGRTTRDEVAFCAACLAPHHAECFAAHGRCALPGCEEQATVRPQLSLVPAARPRRRRRRLWLGLTLAAGVGGAIAARGPSDPPGTYSPLYSQLVSETTQAARDLERAVAEGDGERAATLRARLDLPSWALEALTDGAGPRERLREHAAALAARADALLGAPRVTLDLQGVDVRRAVDAVARQTGRNILVDPRVAADPLTLSLRDVVWSDALRVIADMARCKVERRRGGILALTQPPRVSIQFTDANLRTVIQLLAAYSGKNVVVEPAVNGLLTMDFKNVPWDEALLALAAANGFHVSLVGDILLCSREPRARPLTLVDWTLDAPAAADDGALVDVLAADTPLRDVVASIARQSGQRIDARGDLGRLSLDLRRVPWRAALEAVVSTNPRAELVEERGALVVRLRPDNELHASLVPAGAWLHLLSALADVSLVLPEGHADTRVSIDLRDVDPLRAIEATAHALGWRLERAGEVVRIVPTSSPDAPAPAPANDDGTLRLQATARSGDRSWAIVSGKVYEPGQTLYDEDDRAIEGLTLERVEADWVQLRRHGTPEALSLVR